MEFGYTCFFAHTSTSQSLPVSRENNVADCVESITSPRPALQELLPRLGAGDILYLEDLAQLSGNLRELLALATGILQKGAEIRCLQNPCVFAGQEGLQILSAFAGWEKAVARQRQAEGLARARRTGKPIGRPSLVTEKQKEDVRKRLLQSRFINLSKISRETGVPRTTVRAIRDKLVEENYDL